MTTRAQLGEYCLLLGSCQEPSSSGEEDALLVLQVQQQLRLRAPRGGRKARAGARRLGGAPPLAERVDELREQRIVRLVLRVHEVEGGVDGRLAPPEKREEALLLVGDVEGQGLREVPQTARRGVDDLLGGHVLLLTEP